VSASFKLLYNNKHFITNVYQMSVVEASLTPWFLYQYQC